MLFQQIGAMSKADIVSFLEKHGGKIYTQKSYAASRFFRFMCNRCLTKATDLLSTS